MSLWAMFRDENRKTSMGRVLLAITMVITFAVIWIDVLTSREVPLAVYTLLGTMFMWMAIWAMGPRGMKHLGNALAGSITGFSGEIGQLAERVGGPSPGVRRPPDLDHERSETEADEG